MSSMGDDRVIFYDKNVVEKKISSMIDSGLNNLHIVADFDKTLTDPLEDGRSAITSFSILRKTNLMPKEYKDEAYRLFEHYFPIEISDEVPYEKKCSEMQDWATKHFALLLKYDITNDLISKMLEEKNMKFRGCFKELINFASINGVPLLIFSAGLGDVIKTRLSKGCYLRDNIHIISNFFEFNKIGKAINYSSSLICTHNKSEEFVKDRLSDEQKKELMNRKNVLLLGDTPGDADMSQGLDHDNVLRIVYLNYNQHPAEFKKRFDIVLNEGCGLGYVIELLQQIKNKNM